LRSGFGHPTQKTFTGPDWEYSGRIELVVWSVPALTVILLAALPGLGAHHLDPAKPIEGSVGATDDSAVSLDWKWLFIYPDQKVATINTLTVPAGVPLQFQLTSASVMNAFFIPQIRQHDLHDERHSHPAQSAGGCTGNIPRPLGAVQRRWIRGHAFRRPRRAVSAHFRNGRRTPRMSSQRLMRAAINRSLRLR